MVADSWVYKIASDEEDDGQNSDVSDFTSDLDHDTSFSRSQLWPIAGALMIFNRYKWAPGQSLTGRLKTAEKVGPASSGWQEAENL